MLCDGMGIFSLNPTPVCRNRLCKIAHDYAWAFLNRDIYDYMGIVESSVCGCVLCLRVFVCICVFDSCVASVFVRVCVCVCVQRTCVRLCLVHAVCLYAFVFVSFGVYVCVCVCVVVVLVCGSCLVCTRVALCVRVFVF